MTDTRVARIKEATTALKEFFEKEIPFNKILGLRIESIERDNVRVCLDMQPGLIGNPVRKILHGGAISAFLDVAGGIIAMVDLIERMADKPLDEIFKRLLNVSTIDLRIDYLRPGKGESFTATGTVLRTGLKVAVIRMELHNNNNVVIAAGTGTYIVG